MLVLTRKSDESIQIGDEIVIKVTEISGNRVKICIDAPKSVRILRGEVAEQMELVVKKEQAVSASQKARRVQTGSHSNMTAIAR